MLDGILYPDSPHGDPLSRGRASSPGYTNNILKLTRSINVFDKGDEQLVVIKGASRNPGIPAPADIEHKTAIVGQDTFRISAANSLNHST